MGNFNSKGRLTESDTKFLMTHTGLPEQRILNLHHYFMSTCPDGKMNLEKVIEMHRTLLPDKEVTDFCMYLYYVTNLDGDGYVDFKEFLMMLNATSGKSIHNKLKWAFRLSDLDGDGKIDLNEMKIVITAAYKLQNPELFEDIDETAEEMATKLFTKLDSDRDGFISEQEFVSGGLNNENLSHVLLPNIKPTRMIV